MTELRDPRLDRAQKALDRQSWDESYELLIEVDREANLGIDLMPMLAQAAYFAGHPEITRDAWERVHVDAIRRRDSTKAAEAAIQILYLLMDAGLLAQFHGWSQRAERLLGNGETDSPLHGPLTLIRSFYSLITGEIDPALDLARKAIETATRFDDRDTLILARTTQARALIFQGHIEEGMALLDETDQQRDNGSRRGPVQGFRRTERVSEWDLGARGGRGRRVALRAPGCRTLSRTPRVVGRS